MSPFRIFCATALLILAVGLSSTNHANGQQVVYEGFDYPGDTRLSDQAGGFGWNSSWDSGVRSPFFLRNAGLSWSDSNGVDLSVSGGTMFDSGGSQGNTATRDYNSSGLFDDGSEVWTSFLVNSETTNAVWMYPFSDGDLGNPRTGLGFFSDGNGLRLRYENINGLNGQSTAIDIDDGITHLVVGRFNFYDMQNNEFTFWVDPDLDTEPDITMGLSLSGDFELDSNIFSSLEFLTADNQFDRFDFDEFRMGTTFESVVTNVPEPSSATVILLGFAGVSLGSRRRRRVDSH